MIHQSDFDLNEIWLRYTCTGLGPDPAIGQCIPACFWTFLAAWGLVLKCNQMFLWNNSHSELFFFDLLASVFKHFCSYMMVTTHTQPQPRFLVIRHLISILDIYYYHASYLAKNRHVYIQKNFCRPNLAPVQLGITMGNHGVSQGNPDPHLSKPIPLAKGMCSHGSG